MPVTTLANPWPCSRERISRRIEKAGTLVERVLKMSVLPPSYTGLGSVGETVAASIIGSTTGQPGSKLAISQARPLPFMNKLVLTGLTHPGEFELEPGFNTLGRNPTNDYRVHDATVSSFHCEIVLSDESVLVRDLGSTNGTFIDNQPVHESQLKPGQILRLGSAELRLESQPVPAPAQIPVPELQVEP